MSSVAVFPHAGPSRSNHLRPSTFELLAQEQLRDLLHPVVRYILTYFAQRYPRYLLRVLNHHEEFFACLLLLLERHHLKKHSNLSDHFYQLRLVPNGKLPTPRLDALGASPGQRRISRRQRWGMLLLLVGLPYVRARAQDYYEQLGGNADPDVALEEPPGVAVSASRRVFKSLYPYVNLGFDLTLLGYDLAYLFEKTDYYRPWHRLLGLHVERRGTGVTSESKSGILANFPPLLPPLLLLLKLSQWWYSASSPRTISALTADKSSVAEVHAKIIPPRPLAILPSSGLLPLTPPPTPPAENGWDPVASTTQKRQEYTIIKDGYGKCPLCGKSWQNPAVLPSGWVVCWRCGWEAVEGEESDDEAEEEVDGIRTRRGRCPITGVEVGPGELRKVLV
ncbi:Pex12 amino terminal region-domain-containing protein [Naematelia encephala]|uniref:Peroxisome assembly protein 12 n=1 Tax=Naematelia encephala TaxID=71784 RepID=A0A1Y2BIF1_9TREE|nr:Pex12 amino terminal region-domain-containing protein [Naematelia encephala]